MNPICLTVGIICLVCGSITVICTGVLVYKPYNYAIFFTPTKCSIRSIEKGTTEVSCGYKCVVAVECLKFRVSYDNPREEFDSSDTLNQTGHLGNLNPDEVSIRDNGGWVSLKLHRYVLYVSIGYLLSCIRHVIRKPVTIYAVSVGNKF